MAPPPAPGVMRQPVSRPATVGELQRLVERGALVQLDGRPLRLRPCPRRGCRHMTTGETCPGTVACPVCRSTAARCRRPSGHEASDPNPWHAGRVAIARGIDDVLELLGCPWLPARWAEAVGTSIDDGPEQLALDLGARR